MTAGKQSFIKGAAILGLAAFFTKLLGAVYRIPYQNITGNEGMFVYQQVYPLYSTLLILATAGFPIAISKLVSERLAQGDTVGAKRIFRVTATLLSVTGCLFFLLLFLTAPIIATWMGSREMLTLPIRAVSFALLVVPLMSVIRGYFQGHQNMTPTASSQVAEQSVRVATILLLAWWLTSTGAGVVYAGAGAVFGAFTGAVAGLVVLLFYWGRNRRIEKQLAAEKPVAAPPKEAESPWSIFKSLMVLSIPISVGALVLPLLSLVDSFTVANLLEQAGFTTAEAIDGKGVYDRGQPLIQFASFFATALSLSIVPAVAEALIRGDERKVRDRSTLAMRLTLLMGLPAAVGLAVVAGPTNVMLYKDDAGTAALVILAFTALFSTLGMTSSGILQGVGQVRLPARNLLIGVGVKLGLNLLLIPLWDIRGAAIATVTGYAVAATLNLIALRGRLGQVFYLRRTGLAIFVATTLMVIATVGTMKGITVLTVGWESTRLAMTAVSLSGVAAGALVYGAAVLMLGAMERQELERIPKIGPKLVGLLDQYGWNRKGRSRNAG
ncbi:putative polysaccharide biosynthesis protein [Desmospora activa]|uniref:PST family polysaccharide transporter n=1 Tax=Desmospora activa DSM 45169 TaxID=1121389 RepID=A0A2T4Z223_9BACL|nr:polysaccharide biosynthesis protein [Desmospora activa]PTM54813.1 PST family polysaccharide transporter [Desmospora activa DSM 45169]